MEEEERSGQEMRDGGRVRGEADARRHVDRNWFPPVWSGKCRGTCGI